MEGNPQISLDHTGLQVASNWGKTIFKIPLKMCPEFNWRVQNVTKYHQCEVEIPPNKKVTSSTEGIQILCRLVLGGWLFKLPADGRGGKGKTSLVHICPVP